MNNGKMDIDTLLDTEDRETFAAFDLKEVEACVIACDDEIRRWDGIIAMLVLMGKKRSANAVTDFWISEAILRILGLPTDEESAADGKQYRFHEGPMGCKKIMIIMENDKFITFGTVD